MENKGNLFDETSFPDWTIEEFDAIREDHVFSARYRHGMRRALRFYRKTAARRFSIRTLAAAAALAALPVLVYAAVSHADFFRNAFGDAGRSSTAAHEEMVDSGKGTQIAVSYPEREYVAIDEQAAENLIGEKVSTGPVSVQINDHTLIIDSAVRDENAIVMEFTLNCPAGVNALRYDALMNEGKGAAFSEESTFYFKVKGTAGTIYVDLDRTTETSLHGYYYGVGAFSKLPASGTAPILEIGYADVPYQALMENAETAAALHTKEVEIPAVDAADMTVFSSDTGGCLELSPISMTIDMGKGLGLSREDAYDPYHIETIAVEYKDGSVYQVLSGPDNIDNTAYICGGLGAGKSELALVFNRLVSPADIRQVTVNGIGYTPE